MSTEALESLSKDDWTQIAEAAKQNPETNHFIGGTFAPASDGSTFQDIDPANGNIIAEVAAGTAEDIDRAVAAARAAFKGGSWSRMSPGDRKQIMYRFADLIEANIKELAVLETLDMGKPIADVYGGDIPYVADHIRFIAECIDKIEGRVTNTEYDVTHFVAREPYGVVGAISPWNYPLLMATWKIAPALGAGNSVVLKPAEQSPLSCLRLGQLFVEAGGPEGVFNVVNGIGEVAGKALALHNDVDKISFTGSTEVGKLMLVYAGQSNMKKVSLECGGKSPQIIMADVADFEAAVESAYHGIFANMGEVCNAGSRILVDRNIYEEFIEQFVAQGQDAYICGDPLDPETNLGPLVTKESQSRVLGMIEQGKKEGATLKFGGSVPSGLEDGAYVEPTLFTDVNNDMTIAREEIFGPVASVIPFDGVEDAIAIANDTIYGLAAGVWTSNLNTAHRLIKEVQAGMVWVNTFDAGDMTQPFGGFKQSGNAKDNCMESLISYTQEKSAWIQLA